MRARVAIAAVLGMATALLAHALDRAGALPFVHETADVRAAMGPLAVLAWLGLAAGVSALAAATRPVLVGAASAVVVSGLPELIGRHDPGAVLEPGALAGALVQWLLLVAVATLLVLADRQLSRRLAYGWHPSLPASHPAAVRVVAGGRRVVRRHRSRAPPVLDADHTHRRPGRTFDVITVAWPRPRGRDRVAVVARFCCMQ